MTAPRRLRIALLHMEVAYANPSRNLEVLVSLIRKAAARKAEIICAPEMCLTGYVQRSLSAISHMSEPAGGAAALLSRS